MSMNWEIVESQSRKACLAAIFLLLAFAAGQFSGGAAMFSAFIDDHMRGWAQGNPTRTLALARYHQCDQVGPSLTISGCIEQAGTGETAQALADELQKAHDLAARAIPAPLSWLLN